MEKTTLTAAELEMLRFPEGIAYCPTTGMVTADSTELLGRAHGLLKLGAFKCRKLAGGIKVYGATEFTHNGYGSIWLGSATASGLRKKHTVIVVG